MCPGTIYMEGEREELALNRLISASAAKTARRHAAAVVFYLNVDPDSNREGYELAGEMAGKDDPARAQMLMSLADASPNRLGRTRICAFEKPDLLYLQVEIICDCESLWLDYRLDVVDEFFWRVLTVELAR